MKHLGRILFYNQDLGYGFIKADKLEDDVYFNGKDVVGDKADSLGAGELVEFEIGTNGKGQAAIKIKRC